MTTSDLERELRLVLGRNSHEVGFEYRKSQSPNPKYLDEVCAVGFDTNALKSYRYDGAVNAETDLLSLADMNIKTILPGQVFTEFWNNHRIFTEASLKEGKQHAVKLRKLIEDYGLNDRLDIDFDAVIAAIENLIKPPGGDESVVSLSKSEQVSDVFTDNCSVPFVSRDDFYSIAQSRLNSKAPPGFDDISDKKYALGDFFVWADLLLGLRAANIDKDAIGERRHAIFVTNEKKDDWLSGGKLHPVLQRECFIYTGLQLTVLNTGNLKKLMKARKPAGEQNSVN